jgi:hypothetical protein
MEEMARRPRRTAVEEGELLISAMRSRIRPRSFGSWPRIASDFDAVDSTKAVSLVLKHVGRYLQYSSIWASVSVYVNVVNGTGTLREREL